MIDLRFKSPDEATFIADVQTFVDEHPAFDPLPFENEFGVETIRNLDGSGREFVTGSTRITFGAIGHLYVKVDEDVIDRGWHCRVTLSERDPANPTGAHVVVAGAIEAWFAALSTQAHDTPQTVLDYYGLDAPATVHITERESVLVYPEHPKEKRAGT